MNNYETGIKGFSNELVDMGSVLKSCISEVINAQKDFNMRAHRMQWHIRGLIYHCNNLINLYSKFAEGVTSRLSSVPESIALIMYTPELQFLMYEFYAHINLCKISLDNLIKFVYPLFTNKHLPKSISDFTSQTTNFPVFERIANDPIIKYLIDLRNCLVHYRTFGFSDNSVVLMEGIKETEKLLEIGDSWLEPMAKAEFRLNAENKPVINIFLPDEIFNSLDSSDKKLADFAYIDRRNLLGYSMKFLRIILLSTMEACKYIKEGNLQRFTFKKERFDNRVDFIEFMQ